MISGSDQVFLKRLIAVRFSERVSLAKKHRLPLKSVNVTLLGTVSSSLSATRASFITCASLGRSVCRSSRRSATVAPMGRRIRMAVPAGMNFSAADFRVVARTVLKSPSGCGLNRGDAPSSSHVSASTLGAPEMAHAPRTGSRSGRLRMYSSQWSTSMLRSPAMLTSATSKPTLSHADSRAALICRRLLYTNRQGSPQRASQRAMGMHWSSRQTPSAQSTKSWPSQSSGAASSRQSTAHAAAEPPASCRAAEFRAMFASMRGTTAGRSISTADAPQNAAARPATPVPAPRSRTRRPERSARSGRSCASISPPVHTLPPVLSAPSDLSLPTGHCSSSSFLRPGIRIRRRSAACAVTHTS
mmetsp:Transcript_111365/g.315264  ORF Transcript_111365/g.315264 Transcript_111365/m.315264 type:complete len:358 (+) Transcript_111365:489-1562(+)